MRQPTRSETVREPIIAEYVFRPSGSGPRFRTRRYAASTSSGLTSASVSPLEDRLTRSPAGALADETRERAREAPRALIADRRPSSAKPCTRKELSGSAFARSAAPPAELRTEPPCGSRARDPSEAGAAVRPAAAVPPGCDPEPERRERDRSAESVPRVPRGRFRDTSPVMMNQR